MLSETSEPSTMTVSSVHVPLLSEADCLRYRGLLDARYFRSPIVSGQSLHFGRHRMVRSTLRFVYKASYLNHPLPADTSSLTGLATCLGLTAVALTTNPSFPGYPSPLTAGEVSAGLPGPAAAAALLGKTGATMMLILLFCRSSVIPSFRCCAY
jgi:hypothetical protein